MAFNSYHIVMIIALKFMYRYHTNLCVMLWEFMHTYSDTCTHIHTCVRTYVSYHWYVHVCIIWAELHISIHSHTIIHAKVAYRCIWTQSYISLYICNSAHIGMWRIRTRDINDIRRVTWLNGEHDSNRDLCEYIYICVYVSASAFASASACIYVHWNVCVWLNLWLHAMRYPTRLACMHICACVGVCVCVWVCVCVRERVCVTWLDVLPVCRTRWMTTLCTF